MRTAAISLHGMAGKTGGVYIRLEYQLDVLV
jgi:hypothetical protein